MGAQDLILGSRVAHVRELQTALAKVKAENAALHDANAALTAHLDLAFLALADLRALPPGGRLEIWDGWNLILGSQKEAPDRAALVAQARARLTADGADEAVDSDGRLRVSYTGGTGAQRADRFIVAFVRAAAYLGLGDRLSVRTNDRELAHAAARLTGLSRRAIIRA